jgi:hypothetical protein
MVVSLEEVEAVVGISRISGHNLVLGKTFLPDFFELAAAME